MASPPVKRRLDEYPNVRTDVYAILAELRKELRPDQLQDALFVNFAFVAKAKGFSMSPAHVKPGETLVTPDFFLDLVMACYGG